MAVEVLGGDGFLEPADVELFDLAAEADRLHGVVGVVGIDHQADVRTDCLAHRLDGADVVGDAEAALQLHRLEAESAGFEGFLTQIDGVVGAISAVETGGVGLDLVAHRPAHQSVDRLAEILAPQIPQCDVDAAEALDVNAFLSVVAVASVKFVPLEFAAHRVLSDEKRSEFLYHGGIDTGG